MNLKYYLVLGLVSVLGSLGCASHGIDPISATPRGLGKDIPAFNAPDNPTASDKAMRPGEEPTGVLTLREALALALMQNPELAAVSSEVRAREAETLQAGLFVNPALGIDVENFAGSGPLNGFDGAETTVGLFQLIEVGGKRGKRREVAQWSRALATWDYEAKRLDVLTDVAMAYIDVVVAQKQATLAGELVAVAENVLTAVTRRVVAGGISPVEKSRAQVELRTSEVEQRKTKERVKIANRRLAATWGSTTPTFDSVHGNIDTIWPVPDINKLIKSVDENPDVARWNAEMAQREADVALARAVRVPDLEVGIGIRRFESDGGATNALVAELALPLPLFNRNQGATAAAEWRVAMAHQQRQAASVRTTASLGAAFLQLSISEDEAVALRDEVLPEATNAYETARDAYERGGMRLTDVLDTQRTLFGLRARYVDVLGEYHRRKTEIERLVGQPIFGE